MIESALRRTHDGWRRVALAASIVLINLVLTTQFFGLSYTRFDWRVYAQMYMDPENSFPGGCSDQIDNDGDLLVDCADPDCGVAPNCPLAAPSPVLSWFATLAMMTLLAGIALRTLRRSGDAADPGPAA